MKLQQPATARDDFKARRGGGAALRVWQWLEDPRITIRERAKAKDGVYYRVTLPKKLTGGRVIFLQSRDFEGAKEIARSKGREFRESRSTALALPDDKKLQAAAAVRTLAEHGVALGLDDIVRQYCAAAAHVQPHGFSVPDAAKAFADLMVLNLGSGKPLRDAVAFAAERLAPAGGTKTLAELADDMIEMKRGWHARGDLRKASFHDFESRAGRIRDDIGSFPLPTLTKTTVFDWLQGLDLTRRSKKNYRMILGELLSYAAQKRFITSNPLDELTRQDIKEIEGNTTEARQPSILSPADAEKLLIAAFAHPELGLGAAVVLGLFGGIRTEEIKRLQWPAVRLADAHPFVVIGPEIAKKRRIRNVPLPACAVAWLQRWPRPETGPVARSTHANDFQKRFKKLCAAAKLTWESNAMRHSFGSYHYALHGNSVETARILGHKTDDTVLFSHYRALTTKDQGLAYFATLPKQEGNVVPFPVTASAGA